MVFSLLLMNAPTIFWITWSSVPLLGLTAGRQQRDTPMEFWSIPHIGLCSSTLKMFSLLHFLFIFSIKQYRRTKMWGRIGLAVLRGWEAGVRRNTSSTDRITSKVYATRCLLPKRRSLLLVGWSRLFFRSKDQTTRNSTDWTSYWAVWRDQASRLTSSSTTHPRWPLPSIPNSPKSTWLVLVPIFASWCIQTT